MNCEDAKELLADCVLEALDAEERDAVARHLEHCPDCGALATALATTAHELPLVLDALDAPALPASILERVERVTAAPAGRGGRPPAPRPGRPCPPLAGAPASAPAAVSLPP